MLTRRRLLALLPPSLTFAARNLAAQHVFLRKPKPQATPQFVFIGTDTGEHGAKGLYRARFNAEKGILDQPVLAASTARPVYMAMNQAHGRKLMYVCNEGQDAATSTISTFVLDAPSGALSPLAQVSSGGAGPCYIAVDATGHSTYVADYAGGTLASFQVMPDGRLSAPADRVDFRTDPRIGDARPHAGPQKDRQDGPHPHSAMLSPDNRFVLVNDLGDDLIAIFPIDPDSARLGTPTLVEHRLPGSGPRHLAFHPNGRWVYGVNELANRIDQYLWNTTHATSGHPAQGILTDTAESVTTLAADFHAKNTAAEITVEATGRFVYVSNRGEDSLVVFSVDQENGRLTTLQRIACGGRGPRHFTLDPSQRWLLCGNQLSDAVTIFKRSPVDGRLTGPTQTVPLTAPMYTLFA